MHFFLLLYRKRVCVRVHSHVRTRSHPHSLTHTHTRGAVAKKSEEFSLFSRTLCETFPPKCKTLSQRDVTSRNAYPSAYSESTLTHTHTDKSTALLFRFSPCFALLNLEGEEKAQLHSRRRCRNAKIIRPFDSHVESQLYLESVLSPRDLDLLLVRSCSLTLSLSRNTLSKAPTAFKAKISPTPPTNAHINTVGRALGLMQSKHLRNCTFCQHFHHFYRLQTVITEQSRARVGACRKFRTEKDTKFHDGHDTRISTVNRTLARTHTRL